MNSETLKTDHVERIYDEWKLLSEKISEANKSRDVSVKPLMLSGISLYENLLVSISEVKDFQVQDIHQYEVLPLNGEERFRFISSQPAHYVSYIQLNELFNETKKKIARLTLKKRQKRSES